MYTEKVAKYVADKGISIKKISERTGIPYTSLYNSLMNTRRKRELRADELWRCAFSSVLTRCSLQTKTQAKGRCFYDRERKNKHS